MSKNSRIKRRQKNRAPKHDFVAAIKKPTPSNKPSPKMKESGVKISGDSPTLIVNTQKKDIAKTLVIAAIIIGLFFLISIIDQKNQLLNQAGNYTLNILNLKL